MADPSFARAGMGDMDALIDLMREFYTHERLPFDDTVARSGLALLLADERYGSAWFIEVRGQLAGYLILASSFSLEFRGPDAFVDELYVRPMFQGQGLGTRALEHAIEECRARGIAALHLEVDHDNPRARALYERLGFADHDRHLMTKWLVDE